MAKVASDGASEPKQFESYFICHPSKSHYGFTSWDNFLTRQFRVGVRPVASPDDNSVIVSSCESSPLRIRRNVAHRDTFWLKSQHYSLVDMLGVALYSPHHLRSKLKDGGLSRTRQRSAAVHWKQSLIFDAIATSSILSISHSFIESPMP